MIELLAIPYSPWSEKARWALDHHQVPYTESVYTPLLGEPALRARLKQWAGSISVPILFAGTRVIRDSFQIARYSEDVGSSEASLFPEEGDQEIRAWNERSERALAAGRALVSQRVLADPAAKREALPQAPALVKSMMTPLANVAVAYLRRKYDFTSSLEPQRRGLEEVLLSLQEGLADGREHLVGDRFTFADLCMAVALQCVRPVTDEFIKIGPATRLAWTDEALADKFPELLDWRDRMYQTARS